MEQMLLRGYEISENKRIKRMVAGGSDWQIYITNTNSYVLAVTPVLYSDWIQNYALPEGIFLPEATNPACRVFASSGHYIVSSLKQGPYPKTGGQVEAFSIAFKTACSLFADADLCDAVYIEEYSLVLPAPEGKPQYDKDVVYGKWLTGGVTISIGAFERISKIMSWLSQDALLNSARLAGFDVEPGCLPDEQADAAEKNNQEVIPTVMPENYVPQVDFALIGRPELERFFNENIIDIVLHREQYERMGISFPGATILYGPPGCGKTFAVERLSEYLGWKRFDIDSSTIASSYIHDTSKKISEVFKAAIDSAPSILVIDEMEAFLSDRGLAGPSGTHHIEEVAEFLRRIPEAISKGVLVFAMTNMIDRIDPAILRRGRFDHIIEVTMPSAEEIQALLVAKFSELPVYDDVDPKSIAEELAGHPMSDIAFILREAGRLAVKSGLDSINGDCFTEALKLFPKTKEKTKIGFITE